MSEAAYNAETVLGTGDEMRFALMSVGILAIIMVPLVILIIKATFRVNGRRLSDAFAKDEPVYSRYALPEVNDEENILDAWLVIAIVVMVIIIAMNTFMP